MYSRGYVNRRSCGSHVMFVGLKALMCMAVAERMMTCVYMVTNRLGYPR